jgi:hypothetical protein
MAQQVDVKGFGLVEFPDQVGRETMLQSLRRKFAQMPANESGATVAPYNPSLSERAKSGIANALSSSGLISNPYQAQRVGENVGVALDFLPIVGDAIGGDDLGRAIRSGSAGDIGFAALGAIPVIGDAARAARKPITEMVDLFDYTPDALAKTLAEVNPANVTSTGAWREQKGRFFTDYLPDGSIELRMNDGKLMKRMEPDEAARVYKQKIIEIESARPEAQEAFKQKELDRAKMQQQQSADADDYRMSHRAPTRDGNPTADDLSSVFDDIYGANALRLNSTGMPFDKKAIEVIQSIRGNPDKEITIYRALPKGVKDINAGDWVTTTREYAEQHAKYDPDYVVISKKVKAKDIATDGNSIHEFGYDPQKPANLFEGINSESMYEPVKTDLRALDTINPTGTITTEYDPSFRASAPLGENITTLARTAEVDPDEIITIYRGAPKGSKINPGDYITTNKQLAKDYAGSGGVVEMKVRYGDILDDITEPLGEEYIYRPTKQ